MTLENSMWRGEPGRLAKARESAREAKKNGEKMSAHSIMLSAYISVGKAFPYIFPALWHAIWLSRGWQELNHSQLDVLIQFWLKTRLLPLNLLFKMARRASSLANQRGKPHQKALAYITWVEVKIAMKDFDINYMIKDALLLGKEIRLEPDQPQGLRQFVRILRKSGEIYNKLGNSHDGQALLRGALELAEGEADAPDQVAKIQVLLKS